MATVRMSDYLKNDIKKAFEEAYDKANPPQELQPDQGDALYQKYVGPKIWPVKDAYEKAFGGILNIEEAAFNKKNELLAHVPLTEYEYDQSDDSVNGQLNDYGRLNIPLTTERLFPRGKQARYYGGDQDVYFELPRYEDAVVDYMCKCLEYNSNREATKEKKAREVYNLLGKYTTLNRALRAWPALSKLVDQDKLDKVHKKIMRKREQEKEKATADEVVEANELNKVILSASLLED